MSNAALEVDVDEPWRVVDVLCNEQGVVKLPKTSVQYCEPERPCTLVIGPKNQRRREISWSPGSRPRPASSAWATRGRVLSAA